MTHSSEFRNSTHASFIYSAKSGLEANLSEWILRIPSYSRSHSIQRTLCPPSPQRVSSSPFLISWRGDSRFRQTDKQMVVAMMGGCGPNPLRVDHSGKSGSWITKNTRGGPIGMRPYKMKGKLNLHITSRSVEVASPNVAIVTSQSRSRRGRSERDFKFRGASMRAGTS